MPTLQNVSYRDFAAALTTVGRFTAPDDTVPVIGCVRFEGGPGHLMLVATDRYSMIAHRLTVPGAGEDPAPDLTGVSGLWPMSDVRRALTALRPAGRREYPMMRIEWHEHYSSWSTDRKTPDGVPPLQIPVPSQGGKFPVWRAIVAQAIASATAEGPRQQQAKLNPALLARLPGHGVVAHASTKPNAPALFTSGTSTVILVMPMRQEEIDLGALQAWADECPLVAPESAA